MNRQQLQMYFSRDLGWGWGYQSQIVFDFLIRAALEAEGGVVLDAGAGHQRYKPFFENALYLAQEHPIAGAQNKRIKSFDILCDVRRIPLVDGCVDVVLSTSSLEHFEFPQEFFRESFRVLKPGGSLWINVPFAYPEHEAPFDFQRPTQYGLTRWYGAAGFERIDVHPTSSSISVLLGHMQYAMTEDARYLNDAWWARRVVRCVTGLTLLWGRVLHCVFDRGPHPCTTWPMGWIAVGHKAGTRVKTGRGWTNVSAFLAEHATSGQGSELQGGVLSPLGEGNV